MKYWLQSFGIILFALSIFGVIAGAVFLSNVFFGPIWAGVIPGVVLMIILAIFIKKDLERGDLSK